MAAKTFTVSMFSESKKFAWQQTIALTVSAESAFDAAVKATKYANDCGENSPMIYGVKEGY